MSQAKFCCTCIHWEADIFTRVGEKFGACHDVIAPSKIVQDRETTINDKTILYTEAYFCCNYWRENNGSLMAIHNAIKHEVAIAQSNLQLYCPECNKPNNPGNKFCVWCKISFE
jgi:hypothetical protein